MIQNLWNGIDYTDTQYFKYVKQKLIYALDQLHSDNDTDKDIFDEIRNTFIKIIKKKEKEVDKEVVNYYGAIIKIEEIQMQLKNILSKDKEYYKYMLYSLYVLDISFDEKVFILKQIINVYEDIIKDFVLKGNVYQVIVNARDELEKQIIKRQ